MKPLCNPIRCFWMLRWVWSIIVFSFFFFQLLLFCYITRTYKFKIQVHIFYIFSQKHQIWQILIVFCQVFVLFCFVLFSIFRVNKLSVVWHGKPAQSISKNQSSLGLLNANLWFSSTIVANRSTTHNVFHEAIHIPQNHPSPTQSGEKLTNSPPKFDTSLNYFLNWSFPNHHPQMNFMYPENFEEKKNKYQY